MLQGTWAAQWYGHTCTTLHAWVDWGVVSLLTEGELLVDQSG